MSRRSFICASGVQHGPLMAVHMHQRLGAPAGRLPPIGAPPATRPRSWSDVRAARASSSCGSRLSISSRNTDTQLGSSPTTGMPARTAGLQRLNRAGATCVWPDQASRNRRAAGRSTGACSRHDDAIAGVFQDRDGGLRGAGCEIVVPRIGPQDHRRPCRIVLARGRLRRANQCWKVSAAKAGGSRLVVMPASARSIGPARARAPPAFTSPGASRASRAHQPDQPHRIGRARPQPPLVVVRQKLGLVGRHIDATPGNRACSLCIAGRDRAPRPRHRSRQPSFIGSPRSISNSRRARPRVEWISSRVAWKLGHMRAAVGRRAALADAEAAFRRVREGDADRRESGNASGPCPSGCNRGQAADRRRAGGRRSPYPDSSARSGSQIVLNSRNAWITSGPNIFGSNSPLACPSPCSPESDPP